MITQTFSWLTLELDEGTHAIPQLKWDIVERNLFRFLPLFSPLEMQDDMPTFVLAKKRLD